MEAKNPDNLNESNNLNDLNGLNESNNLIALNKQVLSSIEFIGECLGPLFSYDPKLDFETLQPTLLALYALDIKYAAKSWPFSNYDTTVEALDLIKAGLQNGFDDQTLYTEYRRLFVGPAHKIAPPWGSVYTDRDQVIFGKTCLELREWLRKNGIGVIKTDGDVPEDHIGTMLSLMAWIATNKADLLIEYLQNHLMIWSSHFLEIVEENTTHPFYRGVALLTRSSLEGIRSNLNIEVDYPRYYR